MATEPDFEQRLHAYIGAAVSWAESARTLSYYLTVPIESRDASWQELWEAARRRYESDRARHQLARQVVENLVDQLLAARGPRR